MHILHIITILLHVCFAKHNVYVMRHCVRSPYASWKHVGNVSQNPDAYLPKSKAWPTQFDWGVPPGQCTENGRQLTKKLGDLLFNSPSKLPFSDQIDTLKQIVKPIKVIVDATSSRDIESAKWLVNDVKGVVDYHLDSHVFNGFCKPLSYNKTRSVIQHQLEITPKPPHYDTLINKVQYLLDKTTIDQTESYLRISDMENHIDEYGNFVGQAYAASEVAEAFLFEQGSKNLSVAWGELDTTTTVEDLLPVHDYYRWITAQPTELSIVWCSKLLHSIVSNLKSETTSSDVLYMGHDGNLDCLSSLLGLYWNDEQYGKLSTVPNSYLNFEVDGGVIRASYGSIDLSKGKPDIVLRTSRVGLFNEDRFNPAIDQMVYEMSLSEFVAKAQQKINTDCV